MFKYISKWKVSQKSCKGNVFEVLTVWTPTLLCNIYLSITSYIQFFKFSLSAGQDFITSEQLRKRISKINICEAPSTSKSRERDQNLENDYLESEKKNEIDSNLNPKPRGDGDNIEFVENLGKKIMTSYL